MMMVTGPSLVKLTFEVRAKFTSLNAPSQIFRQPADELLVKRNRHLRPG